METKIPVNGHIQVDSYTVTVGQAQVHIVRDGNMWLVNEPSVRFPEGDYEAMMNAVTKYARLLDAAMQARAVANNMFFDADRWLLEQVYTSDDVNHG